MKFSNYFIKKKIQKLIVSSLNRKHNFCSLQDNQSIMLMFNINDWESVEPCIYKLHEFNTKITICTYIPKGYSVKTDESWINVNEEQDTNMWKFPHKEILKKVNNQSVDMIIDLTRSNDYVMHYLLLRHPAEFKVGKKVYEQNIHDFEIAMTDNHNIQELFKHILFYLQTIRSK